MIDAKLLDEIIYELKCSTDRLQTIFHNTGSLDAEEQYLDNDKVLAKYEEWKKNAK